MTFYEAGPGYKGIRETLWLCAGFPNESHFDRAICVADPPKWIVDYKIDEREMCEIALLDYARAKFHGISYKHSYTEIVDEYDIIVHLVSSVKSWWTATVSVNIKTRCIEHKQGTIKRIT